MDDKVVNSRAVPGGRMIRRRRECLACEQRFTTIEMLEGINLKVVKRDGRREDFDVRKLRGGLDVACRKRDIPTQSLDQLAADIQTELQNMLDKEVSSQQIGEMVLRRLREIDDVAYVRFASVYRKFGDVNEFLQELESLKTRHAARGAAGP